MIIRDVVLDKISGEWGTEDVDGKGIKVLRTTNFSNDGRLSYDNVATRVISNQLVKKKRLLQGDIIIEKSGGSPTQPVGRVVFFDNDENIFLCNNFTTILRPSNKIFPRYFFYDLFYKHLSKRTLKYQNKTTGIINLQLDRYLDEDIKVPSLSEQRKIVKFLDNADNLRQKRKEQLSLLDDYIKSVFLDMFGDPIANCKNFKNVVVGEVVEMVKDGPHVSPRYVDEGIPILSTRNVRPGQVLLDDLKYVSQETYEELTKRFKPQKGDVLLTKGGTTGYAKTVDFDWSFCVWVHLAVLRPKNCINPIYLESALNSEYCYQQSQKYTRGIANRDLGLTRIVNINMLLPPFELQNKFADIVEQVEKTKQKMHESLAEMDNHFNALMQRYFG